MLGASNTSTNFRILFCYQFQFLLIHAFYHCKANANNDKRGYSWIFKYVFFNIASSVAPLIPLWRRRLGLNPGLLRLWHCQSDALATHPNKENHYNTDSFYIQLHCFLWDKVINNVYILVKNTFLDCIPTACNEVTNKITWEDKNVKRTEEISNPLEAYPKETHAIYLAYLSWGDWWLLSICKWRYYDSAMHCSSVFLYYSSGKALAFRETLSKTQGSAKMHL